MYTLPIRPLAPRPSSSDPGMPLPPLLAAFYDLPAQPDFSALVALCAGATPDDAAARDMFLQQFGLAFAFPLFAHYLTHGAF